MKYLLLAILFLAFASCEKSNNEINLNSTELEGYWIYHSGFDSTITYQRTDGFAEDEYGFAFQTQKLFIEHKNSGWCGTPPISYADFEGTWEQSDSIVNITVAYWGGMADYQWKINSLNNELLTLTILKTDIHFEEGNPDSGF